jgi:lipopolysaccharide export system permease protein
MKKIDKLILSSFLGLFFLTTCVAFFVLLMQFFLLRFDVLIGKGLGLGIYTQLASYIGIVATKQAFPLAVLLSSIMALGNLGEYCELTALKSAGVSLPRVLWPLFCFVVLLSLLVFFSNSYIVPRANLDASSLLYDLTTKKPSVAIKEGVFYDGIPGYSIKVRRKMDDQVTLQGIMIYDHTQDGGPVSLTMAESGKIYTIHDEAYMVIELFNGHGYFDSPPQANTAETHERKVPQFYRSNFESQKLLLSLESFKLARTQKDLFANHYKTKNTQQLAFDVVAMRNSIQQVTRYLSTAALNRLTQLDSTALAEATTKQGDLPGITNILELQAYAKHYHLDKTQPEQPTITTDVPTAPSTLYSATDLSCIYAEALKQAKIFKRELALQVAETKRLEEEIRKHELERHKMMAWAVSCVVVFLVGAPLGAVIKKGGIGIPLIIATCLIIWHYIFEMLGEKWANEGLIDAFSGAWLANWLLLPFGLFFLRQAYRDARLPEAESYIMLLRRTKKYVRKVTNLYGPLRSQ